MMEHPYEIARIDEMSFCIEDDFVRMFLVVGSEQALLIDTGLGSGDIKALCSHLTDKPLTLVHTHTDTDHIGADAQFDEIYMHPAEYSCFFAHAPDLAEAFPRGAQLRPAWEGQTFYLGGRQLEILMLPGHTPGSIALLDRERRILFPGDTVSDDPIFLFGKIRSLGAYVESLKKLSSMRDAYNVCYPSHGSRELSSKIVETLLAGAIKLKAHELHGRDPGNGVSALLYEWSGVSFYYNKEEEVMGFSFTEPIYPN